MILYLLRHGEAAGLSPTGPRSDEARPLTAHGTEQLRAASATWRRLMLPVNRLIASPLLRAQQTAEILAQAIDFTGTREENAALTPGARPSAILDALAGDLLEDTEAVALIGHQPHMGDLLGLLLTGSERHAVPLDMGMLVGVELARPRLQMGRLAFALTLPAALQLVS